MKYSLYLILLVFCSMAMTCNKPQSPVDNKQGQFINLNPINVSAAEVGKDLTSPCKESINYAPDLDYPEHTPMRFVKVNFQVINSKDGSVTIPEKETEAFFKLLIDSANVKLNKNAKMRLPKGNNTDKLVPQYKYVLTGQRGDNGIYYHYDDDMCYFNSDRKSKDETHSMFSKKQYDKYGVQKEDVLNVFIVEHHPDSLATRKQRRNKKYQKVRGVGHRHWVKMTGVGPKYKKIMGSAPKRSVGRAPTKTKSSEKPALQQLADYYARLLNHEIGHSLGLAHTWAANDGCDDTPKNNNCWYFEKGSKNCGWDQLSNNVMDYNAWMNAYTPCQLGKIHYNFAKEGSSQRRLLRPDWCSYDASETIKIRAGKQIVWDHAKDLKGDLIVEKNAILQIDCVVSLPKGAKVIVQNKGQLILGENAYITNRCGESWGGIEYLGAVKEQAVKIKKGAKVSNVKNATYNK